ncbi:MAG TPA: hydantoinase/oxoprolinase family protein [Candidatus Binataceae bacterium]|nr:hydantoinase/oxoprolinase family protein [Candidatus Binataceae bacterium]
MGIDTGGTFTDIIAMVDGELRVHKVLSTPHDPAEAVITGLRALLGDKAARIITYSSTVATNALLEKKGARVALFTDAGFEDLIEIGRQNRIELYAIAPQRPLPLADRELRFGTGGRTFFDGTLARPLTDDDLTEVRCRAEACDAEAFAVCYLHSYANPATEEAIAGALAPLGRPLSVSHRLLNEYREYERMCTTVVNAYIAPRMVTHLRNLEQSLAGASLRVMQSNGSAIGTALAREEPVRTILSGPAAGVVGAGALVRAMGAERFITFDMGGTSTDVSLFDRTARIRTLSYPDGYAVRTPVIDIHTVGAGGGSIAAVDAGGSLKVGPESAGAKPGPACYGTGDLPTVTDADLFAGRLVASNFLGGQMKLFPERAERAIGGLAQAMGCSPLEAARGVIRVVNANMERAVRLITVERGFDQRGFALMAFGGAGPMHACELALDLGIKHVILPRNPGLLCAWGALGAPLGREYSMTVRETNPQFAKLVARAGPLAARARKELAADGAVPSAVRLEMRADLRYRGQSYEIEVQLSPRFIADFHEAHKRTFGYAAPEAAVEVVNLRLRAEADGPAVTPARSPRSKAKPDAIARGDILAGKSRRRLPIYARDTINAGARLAGPMVVVELSATTYVAPEFALRSDDYGNLHLEAR